MIIFRLKSQQEVDYVKFKEKHNKTSETMIKFRKKAQSSSKESKSFFLSDVLI